MDGREGEFAALRAEVAAAREREAQAREREAQEVAAAREREADAREREAQAREREAQVLEQNADLLARLAAFQVGAPPPSAPPPAAGLPASALRTRPSALTIALCRMHSPAGVASKQGILFAGLFCALTDRPVAARALGLAPLPADVSAAFRELLARADGDSRAMAAELNFYDRALKFLPSFAEAVGGPQGAISAEALFTTRGLATRGWAFAGGSFPELHARSNPTDARAFRPAFNGEVKSVTNTWLEQAVYYTAMDMVRVFFPARGAASPGERRFFTKPPLGFALVAFPHVGYLVALEWVGKLFVSPASAPFFLGSAAHAAAVAALPDVEYAAPEALDERLSWVTADEAGSAEAVSWCTSGGRFRKLLRADARSADGFRRLHAAYERLQELQAARAPAPLPPPLARRVRLLYGAHEVMTEMDAAPAGAREASDEEATCSGPVLERAAAGVAWLAARRVLYTDLRGPNVLVARGAGAAAGAAAAAGEVLLVDYDDCVALEAPVRSAAEFREALLATGAAEAGADTFAARFVAGGCPDVADALDRAFAAAAADEEGR